MSWSRCVDFLAVRVFFIITTLLFSRTASTDDPNRSCTLGETDQQELILRRMPDDDLALLLFQVDLIIENRSERVGKNGGRFLEGYSVLLLVGSGFVLIPLELQAHAAPHLTSR